MAEYRRAGLHIDADIGESLSGVRGATAIALHRIAREALANIARHNPTNRVNIHAARNRQTGVVELTVADHGRRAPTPDPTTAGFGLVGMSERARALGGTVCAEPTLDGWKVHATLPVPDAPHGEPSS